MGRIKHQDKIESLFEKSPVVSFKSIERIIGTKKNSNYAKLLVSSLIRKKRIINLTKGFYTKHAELGLAVFCFKPAYLGLQSALSHHNVWDQETIPVVLTSNKVRVGLRNIGVNNILIKHIDKKYFFGWNYVKEGEFYLPYSDLEKTFIDMVIFRQKMSNELIENIRTKLDTHKLHNYLRQYSEKTRRNVLSKLGIL